MDKKSVLYAASIIKVGA